MWGDIAIAFMLAFLTTFVITPYTIKLAKKLGAVDTPKDERRVNTVTMPRLGGLAIIAGFVISIIYLLIILSIEKSINLVEDDLYIKLIGFFIGGIIIGIVCFIDDLKDLPPMVKLSAQLLAAILVVTCGLRIDNINVPFFDKVGLPNIFAIILTIGWIVGVTNAINLIDGLDGLSSGIALISCVSMLIIFALNGSPIIAILLITALAGALSGFLPFNFNPAKTFMGDAGSNFLGYCLSVISIFGVAKTYTLVVVVAPLIILGLPVIDTIVAIFRRIIKGKSIKAIMKADKNHFHHKLLKMGFSQREAVLVMYAITAALGLFAIVLLESGIWKAISFLLLVVAIIAIGYKNFSKEKEENNNL